MSCQLHGGQPHANEACFDLLCAHHPEKVEGKANICEILQAVIISEPVTGTTEGVRSYQIPNNKNNPLSVLSYTFMLVI